MAVAQPNFLAQELRRAPRGRARWMPELPLAVRQGAVVLEEEVAMAAEMAAEVKSRRKVYQSQATPKRANCALGSSRRSCHPL